MKKLVLIALVTVLVLFLAWRLFNPSTPPSNIITLSGRIEGDESAVAARTTGRIRTITVREGDSVQAGQLLAVLDDDQVRAREEQARAALDQSRAKAQSAQQQIQVLQEQLEQSRLAVQQANLDTAGRMREAEQAVAVQRRSLEQSRLAVRQARLDASGRVAQAEQQVAASEASLAQAEAQHTQAAADAQRYDLLLKEDEVSVQADEQMHTNERTTRAQVRAARKQMAAAEASLSIARANLYNPPLRRLQELAAHHQLAQAEASVTTTRALLDNPAVRAAQQNAVLRQIAQARSDLAAARAAVNEAVGRLNEARADRKELHIYAPFAGTITTRVAEPGEVVVNGSTLVSMLDLRLLYLRGFVPEGDIGRVKLHQEARVFLDSDPRRPLEAEVGRIDPKLSFTPENTYFRNDRVKQVVGVKLYLKNPQGDAKPGMPADGEVITSGEWPWREPWR